MLDMKHLKNTAWTPTTTGVVERRHHTLGSQLAKLCAKSQSDWASHVPYAVFAINAATNETTKVSPYKVMYGVKCLFGFDSAFPIDYAEPSSLTHTSISETFEPTLSLTWESHADTTWHITIPSDGPYDILQQTGPNNFRISYNRPGSNTGTVVNIARLKRYVRRTGSDEDLEDPEEPDFDELHPIEFKVIESSDNEAVPANDRPILATQVSRNATTAKLNEQHDDDADEDDFIVCWNDSRTTSSSYKPCNPTQHAATIHHDCSL
ncbi:hypothetical protein RvY_01991 [Ramazzottius varieornatus]|uniref:Integrase catalytic domain-containing protein n=1 Tax=Ramazzottius varieornatus TaxID=947166 RepID=A0A1D1UP70_RAMVA|nr:hypothetical protein RvY_01991 [Ramazzottius varieornatus]